MPACRLETRTDMPDRASNQWRQRLVKELARRTMLRKVPYQRTMSFSRQGRQPQAPPACAMACAGAVMGVELPVRRQARMAWANRTALWVVRLLQPLRRPSERRQAPARCIVHLEHGRTCQRRLPTSPTRVASAWVYLPHRYDNTL